MSRIGRMPITVPANVEVHAFQDVHGLHRPRRGAHGEALAEPGNAEGGVLRGHLAVPSFSTAAFT